jgi:hypothetical protein
VRFIGSAEIRKDELIEDKSKMKRIFNSKKGMKKIKFKYALGFRRLIAVHLRKKKTNNS